MTQQAQYQWNYFAKALTIHWTQKSWRIWDISKELCGVLKHHACMKMIINNNKTNDKQNGACRHRSKVGNWPTRTVFDYWYRQSGELLSSWPDGCMCGWVWVYVFVYVIYFCGHILCRDVMSLPMWVFFQYHNNWRQNGKVQNKEKIKWGPAGDRKSLDTFLPF